MRDYTLFIPEYIAAGLAVAILTVELVKPNIRKDYLARMQAFLERCRVGCAATGVDYHLVSTDQPLERTLLDLLAARTRSTAARGVLGQP